MDFALDFLDQVRLGVRPDALIGTELAEYYTPDSREELIDGDRYERSLEGNFTKESRELVTADGDIVETLLSTAVPTTRVSRTIDSSGRVCGGSNRGTKPESASNVIESTDGSTRRLS